MLKKLHIIFEPIFYLAIALYLGYGFADIFLKPFLSASWTPPETLAG